MRRTVAGAARRAQPALLAGGGGVGDEPAGGGDDDEVVDHQRGAGEAPDRDLHTGVGRGVARPDDRAVAGVQRVDDSGRAERVDATMAERRRPARTGAAIRLPEAHRVAVLPHRLAGAHLVGRDHFLFTALFLRVEDVAVDGEGGPARSDRPAPQLDRRRLGPVGLDPHAANDGVAIGSAKPGPFDSPDSAARSWQASACRLARVPAAAAGSGVVAGALAAVGAAGAAGLSAPWSRLVPSESPLPRPAAAAADCPRPEPGGVARGSAVHRQRKSEPTRSLVTPSVRMSVHSPHASRIAAAIDARRDRLERRRLATTAATSATPRVGIAQT